MTAEWARSGLASLFEVPPQSFYPSTGGPSWTHLVEFKALLKTKRIERKDAAAVLLKVITDEHFRHAQATMTKSLHHGDKEEQFNLKERAEEQFVLARAAAWSLMYYLVNERGRELQRYLEEIRNLPRDLDYDSKVLRNCFYRAFGLLEADAANPGQQKPNTAKLDALAKAWLAYIAGSTLDSVRFEDTAIDWLDPSLSAPPPPAVAQPAGPGGKP
jgi:hypothetical protein